MEFSALLKLIVYICVVSFASAQTMNSEEMRLELVQVLFRHGARTPSLIEAKHATNPPVYHPEGYYELTNISHKNIHLPNSPRKSPFAVHYGRFSSFLVSPPNACTERIISMKEGKAQAYRLGSLLRKKYEDFLGTYNANDIHAYTTKSSRTKMSLQLVLAGLYPPAPSEQWHPQLKWRPIPISQGTTSNSDLTIPHQCIKYVEVYNNETANTESYQKEIAKYSDFLKFMNKQTGFEFETALFYHSGWSYIALKYHIDKNLTLPTWYSDEVLKKLRELFVIGVDSMSLTEKLKRLNGGSLVRIFLQNIERNNKASQPKKIYLYSNHDLTIKAFTNAQNISSFDLPPFGSAIIVEKYKDSMNREYIRMLSWNGKDEDFVTLKIPNCSEYCPLDEYKKYVEGIIPSDEDWDFLLDDPKESAGKFDSFNNLV